MAIVFSSFEINSDNPQFLKCSQNTPLLESSFVFTTRILVLIISKVLSRLGSTDLGIPSKLTIPQVSVVSPVFKKRFPVGKEKGPGNSAGDLFGMVK